MFCRTDLCPKCGARIDFDKEYTNKELCQLFTDWNLYQKYKGCFYTAVVCDKCESYWTKPEIFDHWLSYYVDKDLD